MDTDRFDRRKFVKGVGAAGLVGLAGCTGGPESGGSDGDETEASTPAADDEDTEASETEASGSDTTNVGMVYATGGLGDGSFNDQAQTGIQQAAEEFDLSYDESEPDSVSQFSTYQTQYAQSTDPDYDLVSCIGFLQADALSQTAPDYPDQDFMIVDSVVDADNVRSYTFKEHEGSYLVGQLAGLLTSRSFSAGESSTAGDSTNVGFVGGVESSLIAKFEAGFTAGVKAANEDVDVQTTYTGSFSDPSAGQEAALSMYSSGADIVYHAAGNTGAGVFQAARDEGKFAIGVDRDQSVTTDYQDVILASMVKRVDTAVYNAAGATVNGEFEAGTATSLGLADDGVDIVYGTELGDQIPEDVKSEIQSSREAIIDGEISVPDSPE
ncbi:BMP family lipoprotein [Halobaculum magnesiiphilum]|uniref:BMP family protein n=1 Tax=Halobaculum magnesiiphilum TaxID=1017351 RepID=A0A8T8WFX4_9EURY|nr:BMP family protein [Halobaculum magnesiiphilum]QZP38643.1 BMP family protein [Halobaculum magnesiiphilum]